MSKNRRQSKPKTSGRRNTTPAEVTPNATPPVSAAGPQSNHAADNGQARKDGQHLKAAVANPGAVEVPDTPIQTGDVPITEIPEVNLDPDAGEGGRLVSQDPALMTVAINKPTPHIWVRFFPERTLRTVLLGYKPSVDSSPDWHYVVPELQAGLKMSQVNVYLVADITGGSAVPFLWIVPATEFSPYFNAVQRLLAKGVGYVRSHAFRFAKVNLKARDCDVYERDIGPDDPEPVLPSRPVGKLLPEALKTDRLIRSPSHPVYHSLTAGRKLS
jgi:hypothetical protein